MSTVFSLYLASMKEFVRDRMSMFWTLAFPILFIVLFGLIFSGSGSVNFTMGMVVEDQGQVGQALAQTFETIARQNNSPFKLETGSRQAEMNSLKKGNLDMVIVIPAGISAQVAQNQTAKVQMYYDPTRNQTNAQIEQTIINSIVGQFNQHYTRVSPPLAVDTISVATKTLSSIDFLVPGILAMSLMQLGIFGTAQPLVALRQEQVLRRLGATPLPRWMLLTSQVLMRMTIALTQTALLVGIGIAAFNIHMEGNPLALLGIVLLGAATFISLGYLIAAFSPTVDAASGIGSAVNFPMMFLSGVFFPLALLPAFLTPVVRALPLTYLADAVRQVMINGTPAFPLTVDLAVLAGWVVVCTLVAARFFKWE